MQQNIMLMKTWMEAIPQPVYYKDIRGCYTAANQAFLDFHGISDQELLGKNVFDILPAPYAEILGAKDKEILQIHDQQIFEISMVDSGQAAHDLIFTQSIFYDANGEMTGIFGIIEDITDRKASARALREATEETEHFFSSAIDLLCIADTDGYFRRLNHEWEKVLGYPIEDLEGKRFLDFIHPDDLQQTIDAITQLKSQSEILNFTNRYRCKDGSYRWIEWRSKPIGKKIYAAARDITERKRVEEALRSSEGMLSSILETTPAGVGLLKERVFIKTNKALSMITGYSEKEMLGNCVRILYPDDSEYIRVGKELYDEMKRDRLGIGEARLKHKNGSDLEVVLYLSPFDAGNLANGITATVLDITGRKQVEKSLRENEALITSLFAAAPVGIALLKDRVFRKVNKALCEITGLSEDELLGNSIRFLYLDDEEYKRTGRHIYRNIKKEGMGIAETRFKHKNGAIVDVFLCLSPLDSSDISKGITAIIMDNTDRKRAETALRKSEKKYRTVIENIQDAFFRSNLEGGLLMVSPSGRQMFGYDSIDEMIGLPLDTFWFNPMERQILMALVKAQGSVKDYEIKLKRKDGSTFLGAMTTHYYYDDQGNILGTEGIIRDITERKKAEEEIRQLNDVLEQRVLERTQQLETVVQELEAFSYSVSHDLRAPLRAINGFTNILIEDYSSKLDDEGKRVCGVISKETQRMSRLIDDLLSFSRIGRAELQPYTINMNIIVNSVFQELTTPDEKQRILFQVSALDPVVGDSNLLRQVWMNLISNAIKFSSQKEQAVIQISSQNNEKEIIYFIKDNGAGFNMCYAQNLFGVFNRLHSDKEFEGTGVGLAIVQRIVNRHGGRVWGEGEVNIGATFHFSIPKSEPAT